MRRITMRPRVLSRSPFTLIPLTLIGVWGVTARAAGQEMQLPSRPRFLAALPHAAKRLDATNAPVLRRRVSIDVDGATLGVVLKEIARQADLELLYSDAVVPVDRSLELHAQGITVAAALTELLLDTGLDVMVSPAGQMALVRKGWDLGQGATVAGRVTDARTGQGIPTVLVTITGTRLAAMTGDSVEYRITGVS